MTSISSDVIRGYNDTIILYLILKAPSYGYEISKQIRTLSREKYVIKETTLYSAFTRMEKNGYIESFSEVADTGKRRTYYRITDIGKEYYYEKCEEWQLTKEVIEQFIVQSASQSDGYAVRSEQLAAPSRNPQNEDAELPEQIPTSVSQAVVLSDGGAKSAAQENACIDDMVQTVDQENARIDEAVQTMNQENTRVDEAVQTADQEQELADQIADLESQIARLTAQKQAMVRKGEEA